MVEKLRLFLRGETFRYLVFGVLPAADHVQKEIETERQS